MFNSSFNSMFKLIITTTFALSALFAFTSAAYAVNVVSQEVSATVGSIVQVTPLVQKHGLQVFASVIDHGGSTDLSPTQTVYLSVYAKGEMYDTSATFKIADVLSVKSIRRVSGGIYEVVAVNYEAPAGIVDTTYTIDARIAVTAIQAIDCGGEFGCEASDKFQTGVEVTSKSLPAKSY